MKAFMEEYGVIVVAAIVIMIIVVAASPIGDSIKSGIMEAAAEIDERTCRCKWSQLMKISREAWDLKEECFGPLLPYVKDQQVTDINYNGIDVWIEHLKYGIRKSSGESDTGVRRPV